jgi:hypothetical protein
LKVVDFEEVVSYGNMQKTLKLWTLHKRQQTILYLSLSHQPPLKAVAWKLRPYKGLKTFNH